MSKATSINSIEQIDPNVSTEIDNVLAEIESSKHNQVPQQQQMPQQQMMQPQQSMQMPPNQGQQLPPQQYQQMPRDMNQLPQQQHSQQYSSPPTPYQMPQHMMYPPQNQTGGILDFLQSFLIMGDEIKWVVIIAGLFVLMNTEKTVGLLAKYLSFTVDDLGQSTLIGMLARGLVLSVLFVLINKFI